MDLIKNNYDENYPKIIHITHMKIDEKLLNIKKQWEDLNPEYTVELYDDSMCAEVLNKHYGEKFCKIFNFIKDGPIKSDFFRICILYIYGGIYVDADVEPIVPLKEYVDDDIDLMTCISYNYNISQNTFFYNPQFIVCKKHSTDLFNIINLYVLYYENKIAYSYWSWSICTLFNKIYDFEIDPESDNVFIHNNKKYKFIIEEIVDLNTKLTYNYTNFKSNKEFLQKTNVNVYCKYKNKIILYNFKNK